MLKYDPKSLEPKWQKFWEDSQTFRVDTDPSREKFFGLVEFPYPSGAGLHVGHPRSYTAMDVITRQKRMEGKNVLYPIGFDSFGLPTENFAIKTGRPPAEITDENIANFTRQLKSLGFGFDWSRAVTTSEPEYYQWTQWIFLQLYKHGLAYKTNQPINWCPKDKIGLANEEVVDGCCERCGNPVEKRNKEQWMLAITKYADKLLAGLNEVDYISRAKTQQENWIGRSEGAEINFTIKDSEQKIKVFTTRPDTIFGVTFLAVSAEWAQKWFEGKEVSTEISQYIVATLQGRTTAVAREEVEKTGIDSGIVAVNPVSGDEVPVWIVNYVLADVGTGAIMAVPAHDERDFEFAQKFCLEVKQVVAPYIKLSGMLTPQPEKKTTKKRVVSAIVKHAETGEYLLLTWPGASKGLVGGGVDEGEDELTAIVREIEEETGYKNAAIKSVILPALYGHGYKPRKDVNCFDLDTFYLAEVSENNKGEIRAEDQGAHQVSWVKESEMAKQLNQDHHVFAWNWYKENKHCFTDNGIVVNSDFLNELFTAEAKEKMIAWLEENKIGNRKVQFKLRDWVFSRQRYWGEPIPLVHCDACENKKYNFIFVHGYTSSGERGFRPWLKVELEKQGHQVWNPNLPNTETPNIDEQAQFVLDNSPFVFDANTVLLGHSLGGTVMYRILEKINTKIAKALFIDPVVKPKFNDQDRPGVVASCDWNFDWNKIREHFSEAVILGDTGAPIIKKEHLEELQKNLDAKLLFETPNIPHYSSLGGLTEEPAILKVCQNSGWIPLPESELPLELPKVEKYLPTDTGESPLAAMTDWVKTTCPKCGGEARRETDTMPNWAGSSWYFLRYTDPTNATNLFADSGFRFKPEIVWTATDTTYFETFKTIYSDLEARGVNIYAANRLLLNGLNGRLWLPLKTVSVMYSEKDETKLFAYLKENNFVPTTESKGGNIFEKDGVKVEVIPVFTDEKGIYSLSTKLARQAMKPEDLDATPRGHLGGFWYRTVSPEYNLAHLKFVQEFENSDRSSEQDAEKISFLEGYLSINPHIRHFTPVDWYNGGMEHTVLHLLYSRFWNQFLYDIGVVPTLEPYKKRTSHGMILAKGGEKMSKSKGNVVNPDEMVELYGADALRTYIMFMGPFDQAVEWDTNGLVGVRRFLDKVWRLCENVGEHEFKRTFAMYKTIGEVSVRIERMSFNTAVSALMTYANFLDNGLGKDENNGKTARQAIETLVLLLSPFAPHICEEMWRMLGYTESIAYAKWPQYTEEQAKEDEITVAVQVNGKVRAELLVSPDIAEEEIKQLALANETIQKWLEGKEPKKVIYVKGRLVSIVV